MTTSFVHLNVHSEYSIVDGIVRIKPLVQTVAQSGMQAIALTDEMNLFAAVKFYKAAVAQKIKPLMGADIYLADQNVFASHVFRATVLCQNQIGYHNLTCLISRAYLEGQKKGKPMIEWSWLAELNEGLIILSGAQQGEIGYSLMSESKQELIARLKRYQQFFPERFYIEVQRLQKNDEHDYIQRAVNLALDEDLPVVATQAVRFLKSEDYTAHEARVCIHENWIMHQIKEHRYTEQQYLKTAEEMSALFPDIPEALQNTVEISKMCTVQFELGHNYLPRFPVPEGSTIENFLVELAQNKLNEFLHKHPDLEHSIYQQRLTRELEVINKMGFAGYFLIVADFINWAKKQGIFVGPGRGSGAGSIVAFALGITTIDPLPYDLLFERFLNPERVSMPDFDIDFCMEGRDRVIDYVTQFYGRDNVAQIITYGSMAAKAVVRDVGRVLGYPYGFVDAIAKLIPFELGITLDKALEEEELLKQRYEQEEDVTRLIDLAKKLEGLTRNVGKHAGGVVIAPTALTDFAPLYCEPDGSSAVTQFDKDDVEAIGLVKFDFLGLRTLTIMDWALRTIGQKIDLDALPLNDEATYDLLKKGHTTAVFQLESRGMKELILRLKPDCFEDIIALVALYRPGPLQSGMVDDFINRKHGRAALAYPHPWLEDILKPTYGIILYQEQVMQIAQVLAGYTLGAADLLRRAMGKKKPEEMAKQREFFLKGATEKGVDAETANNIFDLMEKFAGYGFNKSHSAAYALISYQTAWLKVHYPEAYMAAVLSSDMDNTDKVVHLLAECKSMQLTVLPPDINHSDYYFTVNAKKQIVYGLGAIKGVGESAIESILSARKEGGAFKNLFELCRRVAVRKVNRRVLEALIRSGACDPIGPHRNAMMVAIDDALNQEDHQSQDLFAAFDQDLSPEYPKVDVLAKPLLLQGERETLGFYLSGHPLDDYRNELNQVAPLRLNDLIKHIGETIKIAGILQHVKIKTTKRGDKMAITILDDGEMEAEMVLFSDAYRSSREALIKDTVVICSAEVAMDEISGQVRLIGRQCEAIDHYRKHYCKYILLHLNDEIPSKKMTQLQTILSQFNGTCALRARYQSSEAQADFIFPDQWRVTPSQAFLAEVNALFDSEAVEFIF